MTRETSTLCKKIAGFELGVEITDFHLELAKKGTWFEDELAIEFYAESATQAVSKAKIMYPTHHVITIEARSTYINGTD
jgi:hypothetical protein